LVIDIQIKRENVNKRALYLKIEMKINFGFARLANKLAVRVEFYFYGVKNS